VHFDPASERDTQDVFRRANERLLDAVRDRTDDDRRIPFLCECLDPDCRSTVQRTIEQFRSLQDEPNRHAIVTGHATTVDEHVVEVDGDVTIVEKG
jgi:hypothetical protein